MSTKKYRPYFTLSELRFLATLCRDSKHQSAKPVEIYLSKYISDIESGFRSANHVTKPTLEDKLELTSSPSDDFSLEEAEAKLFSSQAEMLKP